MEAMKGRDGLVLGQPRKEENEVVGQEAEQGESRVCASSK